LSFRFVLVGVAVAAATHLARPAGGPRFSATAACLLRVFCGFAEGSVTAPAAWRAGVRHRDGPALGPGCRGGHAGPVLAAGLDGPGGECGFGEPGWW